MRDSILKGFLVTLKEAKIEESKVLMPPNQPDAFEERKLNLKKLS